MESIWPDAAKIISTCLYQCVMEIMDKQKIHLIEKPNKSHRVRRPSQTGFSSPATHYYEPRIDLNNVLIKNPSATFYVRVIDDKFQEFDISKNDVLIIDKSLTPKENQLVLAIREDNFSIIRIDKQATSELRVWGVITYIIKATL